MEILISNDQDLPVNEDFLKKVAEHVLRWEGLSGGELSIALVTEKEIHGLNAKYRGKDYPTDVLSFQSGPDEEEVDGMPFLLGDVVICPAVAARQATEYGQTFEQEMALLLTHGILHLLGYNHEHEDEAEVMEMHEREILAGIAESGESKWD